MGCVSSSDAAADEPAKKQAPTPHKKVDVAATPSGTGEARDQPLRGVPSLDDDDFRCPLVPPSASTVASADDDRRLRNAHSSPVSPPRVEVTTEQPSPQAAVSPPPPPPPPPPLRLMMSAAADSADDQQHHPQHQHPHSRGSSHSSRRPRQNRASSIDRTRGGPSPKPAREGSVNLAMSDSGNQSRGSARKPRAGDSLFDSPPVELGDDAAAAGSRSHAGSSSHRKPPGSASRSRSSRRPMHASHSRVTVASNPAGGPHAEGSGSFEPEPLLAASSSMGLLSSDGGSRPPTGHSRSGTLMSSSSRRPPRGGASLPRHPAASGTGRASRTTGRQIMDSVGSYMTSWEGKVKSSQAGGSANAVNMTDSSNPFRGTMGGSTTEAEAQLLTADQMRLPHQSHDTVPVGEQQFPQYDRFQLPEAANRAACSRITDKRGTAVHSHLRLAQDVHTVTAWLDEVNEGRSAQRDAGAACRAGVAPILLTASPATLRRDAAALDNSGFSFPNVGTSFTAHTPLIRPAGNAQDGSPSFQDTGTTGVPLSVEPSRSLLAKSGASSPVAQRPASPQRVGGDGAAAAGHGSPPPVGATGELVTPGFQVLGVCRLTQPLRQVMMYDPKTSTVMPSGRRRFGTVNLTENASPAGLPLPRSQQAPVGFKYFACDQGAYPLTPFGPHPLALVGSRRYTSAAPPSALAAPCLDPEFAVIQEGLHSTNLISSPIASRDASVDGAGFAAAASELSLMPPAARRQLMEECSELLTPSQPGGHSRSSDTIGAERSAIEAEPPDSPTPTHGSPDGARLSTAPPTPQGAAMQERAMIDGTPLVVNAQPEMHVTTTMTNQATAQRLPPALWVDGGSVADEARRVSSDPPEVDDTLSDPDQRRVNSLHATSTNTVASSARDLERVLEPE